MICTLAALFDHPWMLPIYGDPEYIVRIHEKRTVAGSNRHHYILLTQAKLLQRLWPHQHAAWEFRDAGEVQLALHVIDVLALADGDDPVVVEAVS